MARETLSDSTKTFIVQALACFDTPSQVVKLVKEELGLDITRQAVEAYDPTKRQGKDLSKKWVAIFEATRKAFIEDTSSIGVSYRSVRIRALERLLRTAEQQKNARLAADLLAQIAKEMGNAYTNRRELTGAGGKELVPAAPITGADVAAAVKEIGEAFLGKR